MLLGLFHSVCVTAYGYAIFFDYNLTEEHNLRLPIPGLYFSKLVWLTMINLFAQLLYHLIAAYLRFSNTHTKGNRSGWLRTFHFVSTTLAFPVAFTVVILFWGLVLVNPDLVMDDTAKKVLQSSACFNHIIHTLPAIAMLVDLLAWRHPPVPKAKALRTIATFVSLYLSWVHYVFYAHSFWAYPILGELSTPARLLFIVFCSLLIFSMFLVGDCVGMFVDKPAPHSIATRIADGGGRRPRKSK